MLLFCLCSCIGLTGYCVRNRSAKKKAKPDQGKLSAVKIAEKPEQLPNLDDEEKSEIAS